MRSVLTVLVTLLLLTSLVWAQQSVGPVKVIYASKMDVSAPARDLAKPLQAWPLGEPVREIPNRPPRDRPGRSAVLDPALQDSQGPKPAGPTTLNFEGVPNVNGVLPPDTNMDVGPNHIVQTVNLSYAIYNKAGIVLLGPTAINTLWTGFGGGCEFGNDGDPTVNYDEAADRWIISQFDFFNAQCFAVSTGPDPTGNYFRYRFPTPGNDYPKTGVMQTCYSGTIRNFNAAFNMDAVVWERAKMLAGNASAAMLIFDMSALLPNIDGFLPSDLDGTMPPPAGRDATYLGHNWPNNRLAVFELTNLNWNVPNGTLIGPTFLPVNPFDIIFPGVPQPAGPNLDDLAFFMMYRLAYRNFGTHESIVANNAVDVNDFPNHVGIRWYELRDTGGGWFVRQQSTYAPDTDHRWMGSIAMNGNGDIMMGYSVSSSTLFPSIRYTGRQAGDPLNLMTLFEGTIIQGTGSQLHPAARWGDYSSIQIDPSDDFTFCYTTEYLRITGSAPWQTRIASFQPTTAPPNVLITVTPNNPPIVIPPGGGAFGFDINIQNFSNSQMNYDVWAFLTDPFNNTTTVKGPFTVSFDPGQIANFAGVQQDVPGASPSGTYTFGFHAGSHPTNIISTDSFTFTKSAGPIAKSSEIVTGWNNTFDPENPDQNVVAAQVPEGFVLDQNFPNPFNPSTSIQYGLDKDTQVKLTIYNMLGQEVRTLVDGFQSAGFKSVSWDGRDALGQPVSAGVYLYKLQAGNQVLSKKMAFTK